MWLLYSIMVEKRGFRDLTRVFKEYSTSLNLTAGGEGVVFDTVIYWVEARGAS